MSPVRLRGRRLSEVVSTLALFASATAVSADSSEATNAFSKDPIVTDRPTDSASPQLVPRRSLQVEAGYKFSTLDSDAGPIDTHVAPDLLLRYGFTSRFEGRLVAVGWNFQRADSGSENGLNDISLGAKIALAEERGRRPQMGLLVDVSLPVGHSDFTSDYAIPKVLFLAAHGLTDRIGLTYNVGPSLVTSKDDGGSQTDVDLNYAVALSRATGGPISLFGELFGAFILSGDRLDRHNFQTGATVLLTKNLQIDFRVGFGMVENEPDWLAGAGLAFRLPI